MNSLGCGITRGLSNHFCEIASGIYHLRRLSLWEAPFCCITEDSISHSPASCFGVWVTFWAPFVEPQPSKDIPFVPGQSTMADLGLSFFGGPQRNCSFPCGFSSNQSQNRSPPKKGRPIYIYIHIYMARTCTFHLDPVWPVFKGSSPCGLENSFAQSEAFDLCVFFFVLFSHGPK